jgi:hypothetical protein
VNLNLTALPVDVDALHRLVHQLAAQVADDDTALAASHGQRPAIPRWRPMQSRS